MTRPEIGGFDELFVFAQKALYRSGEHSGAHRSTVLTIAIGLLLSGSVAGCGDASPDARPSPEDRAVTIATTDCGHASRGTGSGVVLGEGRVLTAAHVVIGAGSVQVTTVDGLNYLGEVLAVDEQRDLAIVAVEGIDLGAVEIADVDRSGGGRSGDALRLVGGASSGTVAVSVRRMANLDVQEIRGSTWSLRRGYELEARTATGDSGAGIYRADGALVAILFASSTDDEDTSWATASDELAPILAELDAGLLAASGDPADLVYECDPERSRIVRG